VPDRSNLSPLPGRMGDDEPLSIADESVGCGHSDVRSATEAPHSRNDRLALCLSRPGGRMRDADGVAQSPGSNKLTAPPGASSPAVRRVMQGNSRDTSPESAVRSALHGRGLRFRKHYAAVKGLRCRPDIVFVGARVAVFIDGCFWHRCPDHGTSPKTNSAYWTEKLDRNVQRDRRNTAAFEAAGWTVMRFWEHEPPGKIADEIHHEIEETYRRRGGHPGD
jgi:DNA mismatch endonuclease (patch repair protein)